MRWRSLRKQAIFPLGALLLVAVAALGVLASRLNSSPTDLTPLLDELFSNPFGLQLLSPSSGRDVTGVVTIAWATEKLAPTAVTLRYTSDRLPSCAACPKPTWQVLAQLPGEVTSYQWDTTLLPPGDYHVEVIAVKDKDRRSVYSPLLRINRGNAAGPMLAGLSALGLGFLVHLSLQMPLLYGTLALTLGGIGLAGWRQRHPVPLLLGLGGLEPCFIPSIRP